MRANAIKDATPRLIMPLMYALIKMRSDYADWPVGGETVRAGPPEGWGRLRDDRWLGSAMGQGQGTGCGPLDRPTVDSLACEPQPLLTEAAVGCPGLGHDLAVKLGCDHHSYSQGAEHALQNGLSMA